MAAAEDPKLTRGLIREAQRGNKTAFEKLFSSYRERLEAFIGSRLGPELRRSIEPDDLVQETLLRAFQSLVSFQWQGEESFFRWLCGIAENSIRNEVRRRNRGPTVSLESDVQSQETSPSKRLRRQERFARLQEALKTMSADHRRVISMAYIERLSMKEIARRRSSTPGAIAHLLFRALRKLKEKFGDTESLRLPPEVIGEEPEHDDDR